MNVVRIIFLVVMAIHGLIHLLGFAREWNLLSRDQFKSETIVHFSGTMARMVGLLWLVTCMLLLSATLLAILRKDYYWIPAGIAILISQVLIILYWQDAKFGTIPNIIILIAVVLAGASMQFNGMVQHEARQIRMAVKKERMLVTEDMIGELPSPVKRWLINTHVIGMKCPTTINILQRGTMRRKPDAQWMPFEATQSITIDPPAFVWKASIQANPFLEIVGRDKLVQGRGNMLIKPLSVFTIANSSGSEIDEATLIRFLAEMIWYPQASVLEYLKWDRIDERHARVTMTVGDTRATGTFEFNADGDVSGFEAQRFGDFGGVIRKETWSISVKQYQEFQGIRIGSLSEVTWKLKEGDFMWLRLEITDMN